MRPSVASAAALAVVVLPGAADAAVVDVGALRARFQSRPPALVVHDAHGRALLRARFRGRGLTLRVRRAGGGVLALRLRARAGRPATGFDRRRSERLTGFGERSNAVNQAGREVLNYVSDGPFLERDRPIAGAIVPSWGRRDRDDDTYFPVPWLLSSRGYGVLSDNDETSRFDLRRRARWWLSSSSRTLELRLFAGPRPADALRRFTAATGRQPAPPAPWAYGPWFQTGQPNVTPLAEEAELVRTLREADAPVSAAETQMHFLPCGAHRGLEQYELERTRQFHAAGLAHLSYFNSHLCTSYQPVYDEARAAEALQRGADGEPITFPAFVGGGGSGGFTIEPLAQFDFTAPAASTIYRRLVREAVDQGKDGFMEDFGEYTSLQTRSADGTPPAQIHNRYPRDYHCALQRIARDMGRPLVRFQRSGWTGAARCSVNVWGGDPTTVWGFDGLRSAVTQALTIGMSGVARWGSDIGGYNSFGEDERLSRELLIRWIELGAVSGVMRTKRTGIALPSYERPQIFDPGVLPVWRRYARLHTRLLPYIQAADAEYRATGMPLMRHGLLTNPGDRRAVRADDQFAFGPDLLAAPVLEPGARRRTLYLPRGRWLYMRSGAPFRGGRRVTVRAPLVELPLFVRAGAVLPSLAPDVDTLAPYGGPGVVRLADRRDRMQLRAWPRGRSASHMGARRERLVSVEGEGRWTLAVRGKRSRRYRLRASLGALRRPFAPRRVLLRGRTLPRGAWSYDPRRRVLRAVFRCRSAVLRVEA